jgi:hypothetical protein
MTVAERPLSLGAWTHTLSFDDVLAMALLARPGMRESAWREQAAVSSRFAIASQRTSQLRIAATIVRPENGVIPDDPFLADLHDAPRARTRDLVYGRYLAAKPLARAVARTLAARFARGTTFSLVELEAMLAPLVASIATSSRKRTRTAIVSEFTRAGILEGTVRTGLRLADRSIDALAFAHLLLDDLRQRAEAPDRWIVYESTPVVIFALGEVRARAALEEAIAAGRLRRSYLNGEPRVLRP